MTASRGSRRFNVNGGRQQQPRQFENLYIYKHDKRETGLIKF